MYQLVAKPCRDVMGYKPTGRTVFNRTRVNKRVRVRANAAVNVLRQVGWLKPETESAVVSVETMVVDTDRLLEFLTRQRLDIGRRFTGRQLVLIIGSEMWLNVMRQGELSLSPWFFTVQYHQSIRSSAELAGMLVCILPWLDGYVFVPREYLPIETQITKAPMLPRDCRSREDREKCLAATAQWQKWITENPTH